MFLRAGIQHGLLVPCSSTRSAAATVLGSCLAPATTTGTSSISSLVSLASRDLHQFHTPSFIFNKNPNTSSSNPRSNLGRASHKSWRDHNQQKDWSIKQSSVHPRLDTGLPLPPAVQDVHLSQDNLALLFPSTDGVRTKNSWETRILTSYHHFHPYILHNRLLHTRSGSSCFCLQTNPSIAGVLPSAMKLNLVNRKYGLKSESYLPSITQSRFYSSGDKSKDTKEGSDGASSANEPDNTVSKQERILSIKDGLDTRESATHFLDQLSEHQRQLIYHTLNIEILRDKYEGQMGSSSVESHYYLSKYGRPATAKEDPTGTLCEVSDKWLHARLACGDRQLCQKSEVLGISHIEFDEKAPPAPASAIWAVAIKNALPFIGFGFLDNLIMILAGDYIDITIGTALGISTMAAAALGNAISDVAGVGSAWYVEKLASKVGIKDPDLTPSQFASGAVRWACNLGRALGVTIGCLLGMFPLLFLPSAAEKKEREKEKEKEKEMAADPK